MCNIRSTFLICTLHKGELRGAIGATLVSALCAVPHCAHAGPADSSAEGIQEVIVSAQKRDENVQDVPVPVSVFDPAVLLENNQVRLQDYFDTVPGINLSSHPQGTQSVAIRGIYSGPGTNPTVGVTIDDVPVGSSTAGGFANFPDVDPSDLSRIEVLRGPQGTLYGASSIGGLIKYVTKDPSTDALSGRVQVLGEGVDHGQGGYGVRAGVNIPLSDSSAIRASAFTRRDPGYIDNVLSGERNVNSVDVYGGRVAALWRPSDTFSVKLSAMLQRTEGNGQSDVDTDSSLRPVYGDLTQARMRGTGTYDVNSQIYSATITGRLGEQEITSVSAYNINKLSQLQDYTLNFGSSAEQLANVPGASYLNYSETKKFTQEIRVASAQGQAVEWLVGGFYTHESTPDNQIFYAADPVSGATVSQMIDFYFPTTLQEYAGFGDLTFHFGPQFDVQVGGRYSTDRQTYNETDTGPLTLDFFGAPPPFVNETEHTKSNAFTYLVTPRFKINSELMVYARFSSGYRVGGLNANAVVEGIPTQFFPDRNYNYELGVKGQTPDNTLTFDFSAFYIDWRRLQLFLIFQGNGFPYDGNAGRSKSQGLEFSTEARPLRGLTLRAAATFLDAVLTENLPAASTAIGSDGDRLPFSSRVSGSLSANQEFNITGNLTGVIGASVSYVGNREGYFNTTPTQVRPSLPGYAEIGVNLGARYDSWTVSLFGNNLSDRRGIVGTDTPAEPGPAQTVIYVQPRTVGLSITRTF